MDTRICSVLYSSKKKDLPLSRPGSSAPAEQSYHFWLLPCRVGKGGEQAWLLNGVGTYYCVLLAMARGLESSIVGSFCLLAKYPR